MNKQEYHVLTNIIDGERILVEDLVNRQDRTLIYGYDISRYTFHLYLQDGDFILDFWKHPEEPETIYAQTYINASTCVPNKRVYPERCDFEFCALLQEKGIDIPFTTFEGETHREMMEEA